MAFYERGWRGVHVEPNTDYASRLRAARPDETVLEIAVGERAGLAGFFDVAQTGLSTMLESLAGELAQDGYAAVRRVVPCMTLAAVLESYHDRDIHFLKIDVEGNEAGVIRGNDWTVARPWIVVVEAMQPRRQVEVFGAWEDVLLAADYRFVYADGLNRFYLAGEHAGLAEKFRFPPNVFDDFERAETVRGRAAAASLLQDAARLRAARILSGQLQAERDALRSRAAQAEAQARRAETRLQALFDRDKAAEALLAQAAACAAVLESPAVRRARGRRLAIGVWLLGAGMRADRVERLRRVAGGGSVPKRAARVAFYAASRASSRFPGFRALLAPLKIVSPALWERLRGRHIGYLAGAGKPAATAGLLVAAPDFIDPASLPPNARMIASRLHAMMKHGVAA
jgi:FkbM family methyltransferase